MNSPKVNKNSNQTISLCMIVKDEERYIGKCINSVVELVNEIIVVDTGSTDSTKQIASDLGASIHEIPWENDFSKARNFSLKHAQMDWILVLDADEIISKKDHNPIRQLLSENNFMGFKLDQRSYGFNPNFVNWIKTRNEYKEDAGYPGYISSPLIRLFKNDPRILFKGRVHELVEHSFSENKLPSSDSMIPIHHYGKVCETERIHNKAVLYKKIGEDKINENPDDIKAIVELGAQYLELKEYDKAIKTFNKAVDLDPMAHETFVSIGVAFLRQKNFDEAKKALLRAISINPSNIDAHFNLGAVYLHIGQYDLAEKSLITALEIDKDLGIALGALGSVYLLKGNIEEAVPYLLKASDLNAGDPDVFSNLSWTYLRLGLHETADTYCDHALKLSPGHSNALNLREQINNISARFYDKASAHRQISEGELYFENGELKKAENCFKKAIEYDPSSSTAWNNLGAILWGNSLQNQAINLFMRSFLLNPNDPDPYENLKMSCREMDKHMLLNTLDDVKGLLAN